MVKKINRKALATSLTSENVSPNDSPISRRLSEVYDFQLGNEKKNIDQTEETQSTSSDSLVKKTSADETLFSEFDVIELDIDKLKENPFNARQIYTDKEIKERAESLADVGQKTPILVALIESEYYIVDGHYRVKALHHNKVKKVKAILDPDVKTKEDLYKISFILNEERSEQTALDNMIAWRHLLDEKVFATEQALADYVGINRATVNKTLGLADLPNSVIDQIKESPEDYKFTTLYELVAFYRKVKDTAQLLEIFNQMKEMQWSRSQLKEEISKLSKRKRRKHREVSNQHHITFGDKKVGSLKHWKDGRVQVDLKITDADQQQTIIDEINNLMKKYQ